MVEMGGLVSDGKGMFLWEALMAAMEEGEEMYGSVVARGSWTFLNWVKHGGCMEKTG